MARIKRIDFFTVSKDNPCICDKCGQCITNVWQVTYADGLRLTYGIQCFENLRTVSNVVGYRGKLLKKAMDRLENAQRQLEAERDLTEENDEGYKAEQFDHPDCQKSYWFGKPWGEYHEWKLTDFWPYRIKKAQEDIEKLDVNFNR